MRRTPRQIARGIARRGKAMIRRIGERGTIPGAGPVAPGLPRLSLVVPAYNVAPYVGRLLESIFEQSSKLRRFEVIVVDDGSTDRTAEIVKNWQALYPDHIRYIHQENRGAAAARNTGMAVARGKWIFFPDADDFLDPDYFRLMLAEAERDLRNPPLAVVSNFIPYYEEDDTFRDNHPLRYRFQKGTVRKSSSDLGDYIQMSAAHVWFHKAAIDAIGLTFSPDIRPSFEDANFVNSLLIASPARGMSFLPKARYYYRKRQAQDSLLGSTKTDPGWLLGVFEHGYLNVLDLAIKRLGHVPRHIQRAVLYSVFWRFRWFVDHEERLAHMSPDEVDVFADNLRRVMDHIDIDTINKFTLAGCYEEHKVALLALYKGARREIPNVYVEQIDHAAGIAQFYYFTGGEDHFEAEIRVNGRPAEGLYPSGQTATFLGDSYHRRHYFWVRPGRGEVTVHLYGQRARIKRGGSVIGFGATWRDLVAALTPKTPVIDDPAIKALRAHVVDSRERYRGCLVLMDRIDKADDNAEHLYRHMLQQGRADNAWFVLAREAKDWPRLEAEGFRLLAFGSDDHVAALMNAAVFATSHIDDPLLWPVPRGELADLAHYELVFLQHGVILHDLSAWLNTKNIRLLVASTPDEAGSMKSISGDYKLSSREVITVGLPRHDHLVNRESEIHQDAIMVAPTWRRYLLGEKKLGSSLRARVSGMSATEYVCQWSAFLKSERLRDMSKRFKKRILFAPHPSMADYIDDFDLPAWVTPVDVRDGVSYQDLFLSAAVAITDFSSAVFDVALLQRPVIYFQFDREEIYSGRHTYRPGYFDYHRDGFGPVAETVDGVLDALEAALSGREDPVYAARRAATFPFRDGQNCARVLEAIDRLIAGDDPTAPSEIAPLSAADKPPPLLFDKAS